MIYFENASRGEEGFNTHVMSYTLAASLANFLDSEFYFDFEIASSTPPSYLQDAELRRRFAVLETADRSLVSDLVTTPVRRSRTMERQVENKLELQMTPSYFVTTESVKSRFCGSILWNSFGVGRFDLTREHLGSFDLIEWTHTKLSHTSFFYFLPRAEKDELLRSVDLRYLEPVESLAQRIVDEVGRFNAAHLRFGDFERIYRRDQYAVDPAGFAKFIRATIQDPGLPILIATDGLENKKIFEEILEGHHLIFIDDLIFASFRDEYLGLPFTDFNVLTVLNQLICAAAEQFIGTYRSTFTGIIHRLRQERYAKRDFEFFPDEKVAKMLSEEGRLVPDRHGFFDWNRYSAFSEDHQAMAWKREWDRQLTSIDV